MEPAEPDCPGAFSLFSLLQVAAGQALFSKILHDELQHLDELDKMSISLSTKEKLRG